MNYKTAVDKGWLTNGYHDPLENRCDYGFPQLCGEPGIILLFNHEIPGDVFCCEKHFEAMQIFKEGTALGKYSEVTP